MPTTLSPLASEFETLEDELAYAAWLRAKVAANLDDARTALAHDQVMAEMEALLDAAPLAGA